MVKRFYFHEEDSQEHENGPWISFEDYESLERERSFLEQDRDSWRRVAERLESEKQEARRERDALIAYLDSRSVSRRGEGMSHYENFLYLNPEFAKGADHER